MKKEKLGCNNYSLRKKIHREKKGGGGKQGGRSGGNDHIVMS